MLLKLNHMMLQNAEKEFDTISRIGCGRDGDEATHDHDFEAVHGTPEANRIVKDLQEQSRQAQKKAEDIIAKLLKLTKHI